MSIKIGRRGSPQAALSTSQTKHHRVCVDCSPRELAPEDLVGETNFLAYGSLHYDLPGERLVQDSLQQLR